MLLPILVLSIIGISLILERTFFYLYTNALSSKKFNIVKNLLRIGNLHQLRDTVKDQHSAIDSLILTFMSRQDSTSEVLVPILEASAMEWKNKLSKNINILLAISNISTLLGLLGTVTGMILTFYNMKNTGASDPSSLAGGISQALITTAAGLLVAIPNLFAYYGFSETLDKRLDELDILINELIAFRSN